MKLTFEAQNVCVTIKNTEILKEASCTVASGVFTVLFGPNGCGKTTFMKAALGLRPIAAGDILLSGSTVQTMSRKEIAAKIAYVPAGYLCLFSYSVIEFILTGYAARKNIFFTPGKKEREAALGLLKKFGIAHLAQKQYNNLSSGEQQLCLIIRGMLTPADIFLLDEPVANLDFKHQHEIMAIAKQLVDENKIVLASLHDPNLTLQYADEIIMMENKKVLCQINKKNENFPQAFEAALQKIYGHSVALSGSGGNEFVKFQRVTNTHQ